MKAGKLRQRLTIEQNTPSQNGFGEETESWSTWATVWGAVEPLTGKENYNTGAAQLLAEATTRIRIRYRAGLTPDKMRVSWRSRYFDIQHVASVEERDREIHLICKEYPS